MNYYILDSENIGFYTGLCSNAIMERFKLPDAYGIGAMAPLEIGKLYPAGIIIYSVHDNRIVIEWLYIDESYRNQELAAELVDRVMKVAQQNNIPSVAVRISWQMMSEDEPVEIEGYFRTLGFDLYEDLDNEWIADKDCFDQQALYKSAKEKLNPKYNQISLMECDNKDFFDAINAIEKKGKLILSYEPEKLRAVCVNEMSFIITMKGKPHGIFAVTRLNNSFFPIAIGADSPAAGIEVLRRALIAVGENIDTSQLVHVIASHLFSKEIILRAFPEVTPAEIRYRWTHVSDYMTGEAADKESTGDEHFYEDSLPSGEYEFLENLFYSREY